VSLVPFAYPVLLDLGGRRCVVVGERAVREGKVEALLEAGAQDVLVLAEGPPAHLEALARRGVRVRRREWAPGDLDGAFLVVGWSPRERDRERLAAEAKARGALVNVIDDVGRCDFASPAVVRRGQLVLAVGTGGSSPALARKLREEIERRFGSHWAELVDVLGEVRTRTLPLLPDLSERSRRWAEALDLEEAERLVREGRTPELRELLLRRLCGVGAGP